MIVMKGCLQLVLQVFCGEVGRKERAEISVEIGRFCGENVGQQKSDQTDHFALFLLASRLPPSLTHHTKSRFESYLVVIVDSSEDNG
jgi:hypothetical protein